MVLRKTGLDELPLLVVLGASASLVAWAYVGAPRSVEASQHGQVQMPHSVRSELKLDAAPTDGAAWSHLAQILAREGLKQRSLVEPSDVPSSHPAEVPPLTSADAGTEDAPKDDSDEARRIACVDEFGRPILHGWVIGDQPHGRWVVWGDGGARLFSGRFDVGVPEGAWTTWHENGELRSEGYFEKGTAQGLWREFHLNGFDASALEYRDGVLHGAAEEWWDNGAPRSDGQYAEGERDGPWLTWHANGQLRARGAYRSGLREGTWEEWHDNGHPMQLSNFRRGRPHGAWNEWYRDGSPKAQGTYVDGKREGLWSFFNFDGTNDPRTGDYTDGRKIR